MFASLCSTPWPTLFSSNLSLILFLCYLSHFFWHTLIICRQLDVLLSTRPFTASCSQIFLSYFLLWPYRRCAISTVTAIISSIKFPQKISTIISHFVLGNCCHCIPILLPLSFKPSLEISFQLLANNWFIIQAVGWSVNRFVGWSDVN